jgi:hypothetical protein
LQRSHWQSQCHPFSVLAGVFTSERFASALEQESGHDAGGEEQQDRTEVKRFDEVVKR